MLTLALIRAYLTLGIEPDPPQPDPEPQPDPQPPPDDELPDLTDGDEPPPGSGDPPGDGEPDHAKMLKDAQERAARAERERDDARALATRQAQPPPPPTDEQAQFEREEALLRDSATDQNTRYWIEANRKLRASERTAKEALFASRDSSDKQDYANLVASNPIAKKYAPRVEEKLAEVRKMGGNLDRRVVLKMLIGDDIVEGKVKTKPKAKAADATPAPQGGVNRGKLPQSRSTVRGNGALSEHEKRIQRLEGRNI